MVWLWGITTTSYFVLIMENVLLPKEMFIEVSSLL